MLIFEKDASTYFLAKAIFGFLWDSNITGIHIRKHCMIAGSQCFLQEIQLLKHQYAQGLSVEGCALDLSPLEY